MNPENWQANAHESEEKERQELIRSLTGIVSRQIDTSLDFSRNGASNAEAIDNLDKERERISNLSLEELRGEMAGKQKERAKEERESIANHILSKIESGAGWSETLKIKQDGKLDEMKRQNDDNPPYILCLKGADNGFVETPDDLYELLYKVHQEYPQIDFKFEKDPKGEWIRYEAYKC